MALPEPVPVTFELPLPSPARRSMVAPACMLVFSTATVAAHLVAVRYAGPMWGVHVWAFLPMWTLIAALALVVVAGAPLVGSMLEPAGGPVRVRFPFPANVLGGPGRAHVHPFLHGALLATIAGVVLWLARARHVLLGDGVAILAGAGDGGLHELEPLTVLIQSAVKDGVRAIWGASLAPREVTWTAVALVSTVAGALFAPVAWALAGEIERADTAGADAPAATKVARALVFLALSLQGYAQVFCGYVENYAPLALANGLVMLTGLRYARGRGSLLAAGTALLFAITLHLSGCALLPAGVGLVVWGAMRRRDQPRTWIDLGLLALLVAGLTAALGALRPGYFLPRTILDVTLRAVGQRQEDPTYLVSPRHLGDFLNEQALIGPLGIFAFVAGLAVALRRGVWRPAIAFAALAGLGCAAAAAVAGDSNLGAARNWDLMAPAGVVLTAAGLLLLRPAFVTGWRPALMLAVALSAFHTLPWIGINASESRGVERFAQLPLGHGRTESTIAFWYAEKGDFAGAHRWIKRSLESEPTNHRAMDLLGRVALEEGNPRLAVQSYLIAILYRPDKAEYRDQLATAVHAYGGPVPALGVLDTLMVGHEDNAVLWLERSMLLRASGSEFEADFAKREALRRDAGLSQWPDVLPRSQPGNRAARMRDDLHSRPLRSRQR